MRKFYYWIVTRDPASNKPYLVFGSDKSESDARDKGLSMLGGLDFRIKRLPTRDVGKASGYVRGSRLEQGQGLHTASQKQGHEKSLERLKRGLHSNAGW
jgi:hypothetical protein